MHSVINETMTDREKLLEAMRDHPFCLGFSDEQINTLADSAMLKNFEQDEVIFREGDMANRFYLIRDGEVVLETRATDESPKFIQRIQAGSVLGWSWLFPPYYWNFDARATEATKAIFFYGTRLREQSEEDPALGYELMKRMARIIVERLQATRMEILKSVLRS